MTKPILVFGYGNPSRGDDALGPLLLDDLERTIALDNIELLTDFQLQIEHALDLQNRSLVLFVDAATNLENSLTFTRVSARQNHSHSTHAINPETVLSVYQNIIRQEPPPCFLLSIKGESFGLGEDLSFNAQKHLSQACQLSQQLLGKPTVEFWRQSLSKPVEFTGQ